MLTTRVASRALCLPNHEKQFWKKYGVEICSRIIVVEHSTFLKKKQSFRLHVSQAKYSSCTGHDARLVNLDGHDESWENMRSYDLVVVVAVTSMALDSVFF